MPLLNSNTAPIMEGLARMITESIRRKLNFKGNINTGKGSQSLETKVLSFGDGLVFQVMGEDYLKWQDQGRKPGTFPNVGAIAKWVRSKGIEGDLKKSKSIAWAIAINMKKIGMHSKGNRLNLRKRNFLSEGFQDMENQFEATMFRAFQKNFDIIVDNFAKGLNK